MADFDKYCALPSHSCLINVIQFSSGGNFIVSGGEKCDYTPRCIDDNFQGDDRQVLICNLERKRGDQVLKIHQGPVVGVEWIWQSESLGVVNAGTDGTLKLQKKVFTMLNSAMDGGQQHFAACGSGHVAVSNREG
ncbi:hypothetical protein EDD15DRAFT_2191375 [Pisolithus albus]|nr:hypothetical protein EDD15DRAFT_2191375 [Pisolithus albus]